MFGYQDLRRQISDIDVFNPNNLRNLRLARKELPSERQDQPERYKIRFITWNMGENEKPSAGRIRG